MQHNGWRWIGSSRADGEPRGARRNGMGVERKTGKGEGEESWRRHHDDAEMKGERELHPADVKMSINPVFTLRVPP